MDIVVCRWVSDQLVWYYLLQSIIHCASVELTATTYMSTEVFCVTSYSQAPSTSSFSSPSIFMPSSQQNATEKEATRS